MKREIYIKEIVEELGSLSSKIELLNDASLSDLNVVAEYHIQEILNVLFNYDLKSSNQGSPNSPAIDLYDKENSIAVQITATNRKVKIQETLSKFFTHRLHEDYSLLIIVILGKKLKNYNNLKVANGFHFDVKEHVIDFNGIISKLKVLPTIKIEKIRNILRSDKLSVNKKNSAKEAFKQKQAIQKKLGKNLYLKAESMEDLEQRNYMPYRFFVYDSLIVRSIEDKAYPNFDEDESTPFSSWYKAQIHNFYEYGIEFISGFYEDIIIDEDNKWNYLQDRVANDTAGCKVLKVQILHRIPYDNIVDIDMNPDYIYGYPTLFVEYKNNHTPFAEEIPFLIGYYKSGKEFRKVHYFEMRDRNFNL